MFPVRHFGHVVGYDRHAFHEAEQFADVAGPRMAQQGTLKLGDEQAFRRRLVEMFPQMGNGEIHNVLEPLPEWREAQREHVEAVKKVRPEHVSYTHLDVYKRQGYDYHPLSHTAFGDALPPKGKGRVAVISAGTADGFVAWEAARTLAYLGIGHKLFEDCGVAGRCV